jgi:hypothetical protein
MYLCGSIVIDGGGERARKTLSDAFGKLIKTGTKLYIYPEGIDKLFSYTYES